MKNEGVIYVLKCINNISVCRSNLSLYKTNTTLLILMMVYFKNEEISLYLCSEAHIDYIKHYLFKATIKNLP